MPWVDLINRVEDYRHGNIPHWSIMFKNTVSNWFPKWMTVIHGVFFSLLTEDVSYSRWWKNQIFLLTRDKRFYFSTLTKTHITILQTLKINKKYNGDKWTIVLCTGAPWNILTFWFYTWMYTKKNLPCPIKTWVYIIHLSKYFSLFGKYKWI